jgi:signal transduction histidine kinase
VLALTLAAALAADVAYDSFPFPGPLVAVYSVGRHSGRPQSLVAAGAAAAALPLLLLGETELGLWETLAIYAVFSAVWLLGDNLRTRRERSARLEAEREANVRRAAAEEQTRIAREVHDIVGHSVSVMTIQAAAAGDAFDQRPAQVRAALHAIESTGRETLAELRRLLAGVQPDETGAFTPAPGLGSLDALVDRVRAAGLAVELSAEGRPASLSPSMDLTAYRIVQEALTNTLKHARASKARVDVRQVNGTLEIDVLDDGQAATTPTPGHGIIGMRERAALFGGNLSAGPAPGGGFAVRARIPVEETS